MAHNDITDNFNPWYETGSGTRGKTPEPTWDVKVTLNRRGEGKNMAIRFSFRRKAAEVFSRMSCIEISSVKKSPKRIYFKVYEEDGAKLRAQGRRAFKLCVNTNSKSNCRYAMLTPIGGEEKIYRMNWVNNTYSIEYDEKYGLYYIETN